MREREKDSCEDTEEGQEDVSSLVECFRGGGWTEKGVLVSGVAACCSTTKLMERGKVQFGVSLSLLGAVYDPVGVKTRKLFRAGEIL